MAMLHTPPFVEQTRSLKRTLQQPAHRHARAKPTAVRHASCYSCRRPLEFDLRGVLWWSGLGLKQLVDASAMHQIEAHQAGKGERAESAFLRGLGEAQQEEGDEGDGDLNAHGIFAGADELSDLQRLL